MRQGPANGIALDRRAAPSAARAPGRPAERDGWAPVHGVSAGCARGCSRKQCTTSAPLASSAVPGARRHLERQLRPRPVATAGRLARGHPARRGLPPGDQVPRRGLPGEAVPPRDTRRRARRRPVERRRDPVPRDSTTSCAAWRTSPAIPGGRRGRSPPPAAASGLVGLRPQRPRARPRALRLQARLAGRPAAAPVAGELPTEEPFAVCGDFNVAPTDEDVCDPAVFGGSTHVTPPERQALAACAPPGWSTWCRGR